MKEQNLSWHHPTGRCVYSMLLQDNLPQKSRETHIQGRRRTDMKEKLMVTNDEEKKEHDANPANKTNRTYLPNKINLFVFQTVTKSISRLFIANRDSCYHMFGWCSDVKCFVKKLKKYNKIKRTQIIVFTFKILYKPFKIHFISEDLPKWRTRQRVRERQRTKPRPSLSRDLRQASFFHHHYKSVTVRGSPCYRIQPKTGSRMS